MLRFTPLSFKKRCSDVLLCTLLNSQLCSLCDLCAQGTSKKMTWKTIEFSSLTVYNIHIFKATLCDYFPFLIKALISIVCLGWMRSCSSNAKVIASSSQLGLLTVAAWWFLKSFCFFLYQWQMIFFWIFNFFDAYFVRILSNIISYIYITWLGSVV